MFYLEECPDEILLLVLSFYPVSSEGKMDSTFPGMVPYRMPRVVQYLMFLERWLNLNTRIDNVIRTLIQTLQLSTCRIHRIVLSHENILYAKYLHERYLQYQCASWCSVFCVVICAYDRRFVRKCCGMNPKQFWDMCSFEDIRSINVLRERISRRFLCRAVSNELVDSLVGLPAYSVLISLSRRQKNILLFPESSDGHVGNVIEYVKHDLQ